jgi:CO/xanthine dehydrogenase Mo-binding subunit
MAENSGTVRRREDPRLITGAGTFIDDFRPEGCVYVAFARSPHAHAVVRGIDVSRATAAPGVVATVAARDLGEMNAPIAPYGEHVAMPRQRRITPLAIDRVRFVGQPVAAVVASDPYAAADALDHVIVDYAPLPVAVTVEAALRPGAPVLHEEVGSNVGAEWSQRVGDPERAFREAEAVVRLTLRLSRGTSQPMEPRGFVAEWNDGRLTVRGAIQLAHRHRKFLAGNLGLPEAQVRVVAPPDVGGGFGTKALFYGEDVVVAALAMRLQRPVKWIETRREHTLVAAVEGEQVHDLEVAVTRDGKVLAVRNRFVHSLGAYTASGLNLPQNTMAHSVGPYRIPNLDLAFRAVFTNTTPVGAYRGAGRPQGTAVIERVLDAVAHELGLDPLEVRQRNLLEAGVFPHDTGLRTSGRGPIVYDSGDYPRCMAQALEALDLPRARAEQARLRAEGRYLGVGLVNYVEATATAPLESASVRVRDDGTALVVTGAAPQGQGHETVFSRLVGQSLGIDPAAVDVKTGDTALIAQGGGTFGSRTAAVGGSAAFLAARGVREKGIELAARLLEAGSADVVLEAGRFSVRGFPARAVGWKEVAAAAGTPDALHQDEVFTVTQSSFANGTHAVVLEVDPETGSVRLLRWIVAHDCGRVLEPVLVDGQIHGGVVQGLPDALHQQLGYDDAGQRLTATLGEYALAIADEAPPSFEIRHLQSPTPLNPIGAKGAGEGGMMPVMPLIAQAVEDALAPFGVRVTRIPVTRADIRGLVVKGTRAGGL